ncbi:MAG: DUF5320 domain-containing protein [Verrucomicrobiia bacterium]
MPRGDGTGPFGNGPMTGRGAGLCGGAGQPGYASGGWGRGHGWRRWFRTTGLFGWQRVAMGMPAFGQPAQAPTTGNELEQLRKQVGFLQQTLNAVQQRISQISTKDAPTQSEKPTGNA